MNKELVGTLIAMILGVVWVFSNFAGAILVAIMGLIGFVVVKYGYVVIQQILSELGSSLNSDSKKRNGGVR